MDFLRNLPMKQPECLAALIPIQSGRVVSMALSRHDHCQMMLLAFGDGESVSEECYVGDTLYYVLEGGLSVSLGQTSHVLHAGDCLSVPAQQPHAVSAEGSCKLLQITLS